MKLAMIMALAVTLGTQARAQDSPNTWWGISNLKLTPSRISFHFKKAAAGSPGGGDYERNLDGLQFNKNGTGLSCAAGEHPDFLRDYGIDPNRLDHITLSYDDGGYGDPSCVMAFYPRTR